VDLDHSFEIYSGGICYDYSRTVRLQRDFDSLRFLSRSRLALMNSLIDTRRHVGIETAFGPGASICASVPGAMPLMANAWIRSAWGS
jgi:hypothetical protein